MGHSAARRAAVLILASLVAEGALAMWAKYSDDELIRQSDLIVTGTLSGERRIEIEARQIRVGVIKVDRVFKGHSAAEVLLALPPADRPISSTDLVYRIGQSGLWYLRAQAGHAGVYLADHPQRFVPMAGAGSQIEALRAMREKK